VCGVEVCKVMAYYLKLLYEELELQH